MRRVWVCLAMLGVAIVVGAHTAHAQAIAGMVNALRFCDNNAPTATKVFRTTIKASVRV